MKCESMKAREYLKYKNPNYVYIHVVPQKSMKNYTSKSIAKTIALTYKDMDRLVKVEQNKLFFKTNFKISYIVDITKDNIGFYFLVPEVLANTISKRIEESWSKSSVSILEKGMKPFSDNSEIYELSYKKEDALSLQVDTLNKEPLCSILSTLEIMEDGDRVGICYNFMPAPQSNWVDQYNLTMTKIKNNKSVDKNSLNFNNILKVITNSTLSLLDSIFTICSEVIFGKKSSSKSNVKFADALLSSLNNNKNFTLSTKRKRDQLVLQTQIAVISSSDSNERRHKNAINVCESFKVLDGDNELKYKKIKRHNLDLTEKSLNLKSSYLSTDEVSNFIQVPELTPFLLKDKNVNSSDSQDILSPSNVEILMPNNTIPPYNSFEFIDADSQPVNLEECALTKENQSFDIPRELLSGTKHLGKVFYKGGLTDVYMENDYNNGNLPFCAIGSQGGGKTTFLQNYAKDCALAGESLFVIDFIKDCELSDSIKKVVPEEKVIELDLSKQEDIQGFGYNEIKIPDELDDFEKLSLANMQVMQTLDLIDSINTETQLSVRMRRYLHAAAYVTFVQNYNSIKNVIECLEDHVKRNNYIEGLSDGQKEFLEDEIRALRELDEYSKPTKECPPEVIGTLSRKVESILDRVSLLKEDFKLKFMYNKSLDNNIDFVNCMNDGKIVLLKMKESEFPTKMHKNMLVTYFVTKLWLASQIRGSKYSAPTRCNVLIDEVFQAPTCMRKLDYILPQSRKFGLKFFFTLQYAKQLKGMFHSLMASGASFMLLTGCKQDDFNKFKDILGCFEYEDLRDMPKFHAMCLIKYSNGYARFISELPPPASN